jgi:uncharacterized surface protein with fasciclin (FAS1) repeats
MRNFGGLLLLFVSLLVCLSACHDKEFEDHYGRPDWLPSPVYQQLEAKGNFKSFLACVDKAGYKNSLSGAGYFTVFAPNDAAFETFLNEQGLSGIDAVDEAMARKIVTYALVYNSFEKARLSDYQSNTGWQPLNAFKRRTAYYDGVYSELTADGRNLKVTSSNRNGGYVFGDNNNKYIPYFIDAYLAAKNLSAFDYNYFYPNVTYSGFNVANASVVTADIQAENGTIHEIDKVILPLPSVESYISQKPQYSVFKALLDKYEVAYQTHPEVTNRYRIMTGSDESVYVKFYSFALGFSPNNENFLKVADNDGQSDGWTMFVPTNEAVNDYVNKVLLEHYKSLDEMPPGIINDFINAHMWQTTVWPSKFKTALNVLGEEARFDPASSVVDASVLSNGMLYGTNKAQDADVFRSVYGRAYLDPNYSLMTRFLNRELKTTIKSPYVKFTLFLVPDAVLRAAGHDYNITTSEWVYNGSTNLAVENWTRMINMHVLITQKGELNNLSGQGIAETYGGEFVKYSNNTVFAAGNLEKSITVKVNTPQNPSKTVFNGIVHYADNIIRFPDNNPVKGLGFYIRDQGDAVGKPYQRFYDYLKNAAIFNPTTGDINGVSSGVYYTFFIPNNAAIAQAVTDGVLPASVTPTSDLDRQKVIDFILYHILPKFSIIGNGKEEGSFESLFKTISGDATVLTISNKPTISEFKITDMKGRVANVVNSTASNVLGNRAVFHQIDKYLRY